jgi:8-oxo-dGTP diphosphatase
LRIKRSPDTRRSLISRARDIAHRAGCQILLNCNMRAVCELQLDGVHLPASDLMKLQSRPLDARFWVAASCHDERELEHAAKIGADFAVLGSVFATPSHPSAPLGWKTFAAFCRNAPLPVYALGGVRSDDLHEARRHGAIGIAGIRMFWPKPGLD